MLKRFMLLQLVMFGLTAQVSATEAMDEASSDSQPVNEEVGQPADDVTPPPPPGPYMSTALPESPDFGGEQHSMYDDMVSSPFFSPDMPWPSGRNMMPRRWMPDEGYVYAPPQMPVMPRRTRPQRPASPPMPHHGDGVWGNLMSPPANFPAPDFNRGPRPGGNFRAPSYGFAMPDGRGPVQFGMAPPYQQRTPDYRPPRRPDYMPPMHRSGPQQQPAGNSPWMPLGNYPYHR